eukprot:379410-Alexandrium_andersonii.AAC.1
MPLLAVTSASEASVGAGAHGGVGRSSVDFGRLRFEHASIAQRVHLPRRHVSWLSMILVGDVCGVQPRSPLIV